MMMTNKAHGKNVSSCIHHSYGKITNQPSTQPFLSDSISPFLCIQISRCHPTVPKNPLTLVLTWMLVPTYRVLFVTAGVREALYQTFYRNRNMNNKVIKNRGSPVPPTALEARRVIQHHPNLSCRFLDHCWALWGQSPSTDANLRIREMLKKSPFDFSLPLAHDHSPLQTYEPEISAVMYKL